MIGAGASSALADRCPSKNGGRGESLLLSSYSSQASYHHQQRNTTNTVMELLWPGQLSSSFCSQVHGYSAGWGVRNIFSCGHVIMLTVIVSVVTVVSVVVAFVVAVVGGSGVKVMVVVVLWWWWWCGFFSECVYCSRP